jgi:hypothetical protein
MGCGLTLSWSSCPSCVALSISTGHTWSM